MTRQACLTCGKASSGRRCPKHAALPGSYGRRHREIRAQVLATETACWICGKPGTDADPLTADHLVPIADGGRNVRSNYRAAHETCNKRRGATPVERVKVTA